jgi:O-antigen/teichoic acid export membrane protein
MAVTTILVRYITVVVQFFIIFGTINIFGSQARGVVAGLIATFGFLGALSAITIGRGLISVITNYTDNKRDVNNIYLTTLLLMALLITLSFIVHVMLYNYYPQFYGKIEPEQIKYFSLAIFYYVWLQIAPYLFSIAGRLKVYNLLVLASNFTIVCFMMLFWFSYKPNLNQFLLVVSTTFFLEVLIGVILIILIESINLNKPRFINEVIKSGSNLHIDTIGGLMLSSIGLVIVNNQLSLNDVSVYDLSIRFFGLLCITPQMFQLYYNKLVVHENTPSVISKQLSIFRKIIIYYLIIYPISILVLFFVVNKLSLDYRLIYLYAILAIAFLPYFYCSIISPYWIKLGKGKMLSITTVFIGIVNLSIIFLLVDDYGVFGVAAGVPVSYFIAAYVNWLFYKNKIKVVGV